jgi:hypothetical protein
MIVVAVSVTLMLTAVVDPWCVGVSGMRGPTG